MKRKQLIVFTAIFVYLISIFALTLVAFSQTSVGKSAINCTKMHSFDAGGAVGGERLLSKTTRGSLSYSGLMNKISDKNSSSEVIKLNFDGKNSENALKVSAKSAYLTDSDAKFCIYEQNANKRLPIASMCKIMTLLICFEGVEAGAISLSDTVSVGKNAADMGGSQVYLEANESCTVAELIKSIVICSANDSCVALAEYMCGSEQAFVAKMNKRAQDLGLSDTLFANCTGLPKDTQYSCAKDVAVMFSKLIKHKEYYDYSKIWLQDFKHEGERVTQMTNTNKLIRQYDGCDGGKTGYTSEAGYCLAATALRSGTRAISVIIGAEDSKTRFNDTANLFNHLFANYESKQIFCKDAELELFCPVAKGKVGSVRLCAADDAFVFSARGEKDNITVDYQLNNATAPVRKGDNLGYATIYKNGVEYCQTALVAASDVNRSTLLDEYKRIADKWSI